MNSTHAHTSQQDLSVHQALRADGQWEGYARVAGMNCGACAIDLQQAALKIQGLSSFQVNPASGLVSWVASQPTAIDLMAQRAARMGYALGMGSLADQDVQAQRNRLAKRNMFLRFLVAMLCMMQIMMYSAPEYFFDVQHIGEQPLYLLRWAQWVICLPVLLYCAAPCFGRAWRATLQSRLVMDQPIALGIVLAFGTSSLNLMNPAAHVWFDSVAMLLALLLLAQWLIERQTAKALDHLASLQPDLPLQVEVFKGDCWQPMPVVQLQAGDRFCLQKGQALPVDAVLTPGAEAVWVDEAMRTGEQTPLRKQAGDLLCAGSKVLIERAEFTVLAVGPQGSFGRLGDLLARAMAAKPSRQLAVDRLLPYFVATVLVSASIGGLWWWLVLANPAKATEVAVAVLIVTCPCALALALPLVRLFAIQRLVDLGVLVRNPQALDLLATVDVVALDKTGTLTQAEATQVQLQVLCNIAPWTPAFLHAHAVGMARASNHPLSRAVAQHGVQQGLIHSAALENLDLQALQEIPGKGLFARVWLQGVQHPLKLGSPAFVGLRAAVQNACASVVVFAVFAESDPCSPIAALQFEINQSGGPQLLADIEHLKTRAALHVLSGDLPAAVQAWQPALRFTARHAGQTPEDKTNWIKNQQAQGRVLAMVGDGLNDLAAFAQADVAVAAAGAATLSASQADVLLLRPGLSGLAAACDLAQKTRQIGKQNLVWAMAYNGVAIPLAMSGWLSPWMAALGMGASSLLVLVNSLRLKARPT